MTPSGIEPATFRFVAQHLNHCAIAVTNNNNNNNNTQFYITQESNKPETARHGVLFPARVEFSVCFHIQIGFEVHSASYPGDTGHYFVSIKGSKAPV